MSRRPPGIDPKSPVPLYHQIAEAIRARIAAGHLAPGDALEPLRQAAETWHVNLHTVRHAYAALARGGWVESRRGPRGTRVVGAPQPTPRNDDFQTFARRVVDEAARLYGANAADLASALRELESSDADARLPTVWVVECSSWQAEGHAREVRERFAVEVQAWVIADGEPPEGTVLSSYFHYNDVRRLWPRRLRGVHFCGIHPDPALTKRLADATRLIVTERDASTAEAVTADLVALLAPRCVQIDVRVADDPAATLDTRAHTPVVYAPRIWAELDETSRRDPRAIELRYVFDTEELDQLAATLQWKSRQQGIVA